MSFDMFKGSGRHLFAGVAMGAALLALGGCSANSDGTGTGGNTGGGGPAPQITFSATPTSLTSGDTTTLTWNTTGAASCLASKGDATDNDGWAGKSGKSGTYKTPALTTAGTYPYVLSCASSTGATSTSQISVIVGSGGPAINFSASPSNVVSGGTTTLAWSTTNATSCQASGGDAKDSDGWAGNSGTSNVFTTSALTTSGTYTYNLSCSASDGATNVSSLTITVGNVPAPTVSISANPASVASGATSSIKWSTANAASCKAVANSDPAWTGSLPTDGSFTTTAVTGPASVSYTLSCTGPASSGSQTGAGTAVLMTAGPATPPPAFSQNFTANPSSVPLNGTSVLTWATTNAVSCVGTGGNPADTWDGSTQPPNGTFTTQPFATAGVYQYTLTCSGDSGTVAQTVNITAGSTGTPSVSMLVNGSSNATIDLGTTQNATLSWTSANVDNCTASGSWSGSKPLSGTMATGVITTDGVYSYTLSCTGGGGPATSTATLTVTGTVPPGPTSCGVGVNSVALINAMPSDQTFKANPDTTNCGLLGLCSVTNPDNAVDPDVTNFAVLTDTLGLLGTGSVTFQVADTGSPAVPYAATAPRQVGFLVANPNQLLVAAALSPITLETLHYDDSAKSEVVQETATSSNNGTVKLNLLGLLGNNNLAFLSFTATKPFDTIQMTEGAGVASVNSQLNIYAACVADPFPTP